MNAAAEALAFEKAAQVRDQIRALSRVLHKQYADSARDEDLDIVVAVEHDGAACVNHAMVRGGRHLGDHAHFPAAGQGSEADMLLAFLAQHFAAQAPPGRIVVNVLPQDEYEAPIPGVQIALARNERERAWSDMALKNAEIALRVKLDAGARASHRVRALVEALELDVAPERIECFDISHTMGEATVASCVVWASGAMRNGEYRRYNIDGITPGDDYGAMRQVLTRRYEKVATGEGARPDLVLIDGGRGQLGIAVEVMAELGLDLPLIGVAKGEERRMGAEELIRPGVADGLVLGSDHPALHLIAEIRDEAHRFAIAGHRARRSKARLTSSLEDIPGIGPARRKRLLTTFGGLTGVRNATVEDLCRVEGISRKLAEQIQRQLN
jgi:excinuclease ABC subunit C